MEDLDGLRQAQDPAEQRDLVAGEPEWLAAPVPVLVERADRLGRLVRQADHERDLGPAVAPRPHQRPRHLALVLDGEQAVQPRARRAPGRDRLDRPHERREGPRPVDALGAVLGLVVVGSEQRRHVRGVCRAAGVLEKQRVEEVRPGRGIQPQLLGEPHPDHARPRRVAGRLSLRDVERVGQRADHLRQEDRSRAD